MLRHAGRGASATVSLRSEPTALTITVDDDGAGTPNLLSSAGSGHGHVGIRERIAVFGGTLQTGPRPGGGYRVLATLPAKPVSRPAEPVADRPGRSRGRRHVSATPTTVLIVDDQALVRTGLRLILETEPDLEVVGEAADGYEAVAAVEQLRPQIVLMDIRMPRLDGIEATRRICRRRDSAGC